jgi:hypothetical protein
MQRRKRKRCGHSGTFKENFDFATCHKPFIFFRFMAGTTGLEPATSAVTVSQIHVTYRNYGQRVAPIVRKRHTKEPLVCPYCVQEYQAATSAVVRQQPTIYCGWIVQDCPYFCLIVQMSSCSFRSLSCFVKAGSPAVAAAAAAVAAAFLASSTPPAVVP